MTYARLECDVDDTEEAELRRLEEGSSDGAGNGLPTSSCAASRGSGQEAAAAHAPATGKMGQADGHADARQTLVTGYAEHRASLSEKNKYRRAIKIDLKLPEASTALAGVPRRKEPPHSWGV